MFTWNHLVQFYETDLMGIVHHSNYLRFFEEARVAWAHAQGILDYQKKESAYQLAVLESQTRHLRPSFFGDRLQVSVQVKRERAKIFFQYQILSLETGFAVAVGTTTHAVLNLDLKPIKIPENLKQKLEKESWTETWL
jgi:acyl-CoA thioester hydrolase